MFYRSYSHALNSLHVIIIVFILLFSFFLKGDLRVAVFAPADSFAQFSLFEHRDPAAVRGQPQVSVYIVLFVLCICYISCCGAALKH